MADIITNDQYYKDIADAIRDYTQGTEIYRPEEMKSGIDDVYSKGFDDGFASGEEFGIEEGQKAQYDYFWDNFQKNGTRTAYDYAFYNWDKFQECFKPKYDIKPIGSAFRMFSDINQYVSLSDLCEKAGITIDFSGVNQFQYILYGSAIYRIGVMDCSSATTLQQTFVNASSLQTIDKLIVHEGITAYTDCFASIINLRNITIEGVIAGTGFNVSSHKNLTRDSLFGIPLTKEEAADLPSTNVVELNGNYYYGGIIPALKDYSGTSTTKTITLGATNLAKLTDAEKAIATSKGWTLA